MGPTQPANLRVIAELAARGADLQRDLGIPKPQEKGPAQPN
jgi:hypothetical protein